MVFKKINSSHKEKKENAKKGFEVKPHSFSSPSRTHYSPQRASKASEKKEVFSKASKVLKDFKEKDDTSWGNVSSWYDKHLSTTKNYHDTLVYPNLVRLLGDVKKKKILDLACGQGIFSHRLASLGAMVVGVDLGASLIEIAKSKNISPHNPDFFISPSHDLYMIRDESIDDVLISLAIQNIEKVKETFAECSRVQKKGGRLFIVMNHPAFRIPKGSRWGYDEDEKVQYRRVDSYLSESKVKMDMTPGSSKNKEYTYSFHRPLQYYSKLLEKSGYLIRRIEEWESDRISERGPRKEAEDMSRKEIPLFLLIEAVQWEA